MKNHRTQYRDLLCERILQGLDSHDEQRFRRLDATLGGDPGLLREREGLEIAAAALHLALLDVVEPLPPPLRRDLEVRARAWPSRCAPTDLP